MNKTGKIKYLLIIVGVIFLTIGSIKLIFLSNDSDNTPKNDNKNEDIKHETLYEKNENDKNIEIKENFDGKDTTINCPGNDISNCQLSVNENYILDNNDDREIENIYRLEDVILVLVKEKKKNNGYLYLIDKDGLTIDIIGERMEGNLVLKMTYPSKDFGINGTKITFYMTSIQDERKLLSYDNILIDVYDDEKINRYAVLDDSIVAAKYEIEYLEDNKFSEIKVVEKTTYKDLREKLDNSDIYN